MLQKDKKWVPWRLELILRFLINQIRSVPRQKIQLFSCPGIVVELAIISITGMIGK
jgi:hypothetical protein